MSDKPQNTVTDEISAMGKIAEALESLVPEAKKRVLIWAAEVSGISAAELVRAKAPEPVTPQAAQHETVSETRTASPKPKAKGKSGRLKESYTLVKNINFGLPGEKNSLFDYVERYGPGSSIQNNVVFVKYLSEQHKDTKINADLIYSCFSTLGAKLPKALYASLLDTAKASKGYGYIDTSDVNDIKLVHKGEVLLHELLKKVAKAA